MEFGTVRAFFMDDSANELLCFFLWPLQRQQWVLLCNCLVGALPYSHYVMRSFPLCGVRVLHPAQISSNSITIIVTAKRKTNSTLVVWLAQ